jgi:hypothetical protein
MGGTDKDYLMEFTDKDYLNPGKTISCFQLRPQSYRGYRPEKSANLLLTVPVLKCLIVFSYAPVNI